MRLTRLAWWRLSLLAVALTACAKAPPPPPPPPEPVALDIMVEADGTVNPDIAGRASPVVLRSYQLRTEGAFEGGDFFALYGNAAAVLGPDLVASQDTAVRPGEHKELKDTLDPHTRLLGIVAGFRDVNNAHWRAVVSVPAKGPTHQQLGIRLHGLTVDAGLAEPPAPSGSTKN